jgi:HD-GYP domain-containing protein (c-di-GMP phosphodiesterase class II)
VVLQHHERWDGEGYPRRISGTAIDMGARIVSVADAFEAMVSQKPYRNSMMGYQAMKNLLSDNSRRFDPDVLKAFIQTMGIYPIGSIIFLNNGALARVVEVHGSAPLRPKIRVLIDEFGKVFQQDEGEILDLLTEKSLFIARAVDPKEVAKKNG